MTDNPQNWENKQLIKYMKTILDLTSNQGNIIFMPLPAFSTWEDDAHTLFLTCW